MIGITMQTPSPAPEAGLAAASAFAPIALASDVVPVLPTRNLVLFPHALAPITVGRPASVAALHQALAGGGPLCVVLQRDPGEDTPGRDALHDVGTLAQVLQHGSAVAGQEHAMCRGEQRCRIVQLVEGLPFLAARIERIDEPAGEASVRTDALQLQVHQRAAEMVALLPGVPVELAQGLQALSSPGQLADIVASLLDAEPAGKQHLLETLPVADRLMQLLELLEHRIHVLQLAREIGERTRETLDDRQRRHLLREQLETIRRELGEDGGTAEDLERLGQAIARAGMPEEAEREARRTLERLSRMDESAGEGPILRTWLEWMTELPWLAPEPMTIDLDAARAVLEADHHGLEDVKQRIVEHLAVLQLNPDGRAPILCFVGPPGVGKTSLGQSIARALGRPFVRVSLGGVHDEAEIRGHRRTYVGALPGSIVQGLRKAGARHCVMLLDELDKLGVGPRGDPSAALLEVLDPEQNATFRDHYLGVPFDLSRVFFIGTANVIDTISAPVLDRMETITLPGYTQQEKIEIARRYLLRRQREACGLRDDQVRLADDVLPALITGYTREAGVRQLEREIGRLMRGAAVRVATGAIRSDEAVQVAAADLEPLLGPARFEYDTALRAALPGVTTGLAWTPVGGELLFIEAARVQGSGRLILTGQLGEVMRESAQAALTLAKARAPALSMPPAAFEHVDIHVHVPAGAIPKDGPSAGLPMFMAIASLFTGRAVEPALAMTGEVSLRGLVLPVGGVKQKVLAAQRAGAARVMLPARNRKDLRDIPPEIRAALEFVLVDDVDAALRAALPGALAGTPLVQPVGAV